MSGKSPIQWTETTWNPVVGCKRVSAGCDHCYAFDLHDKRHIAWKRGRWPNAPKQYHQPFSRVQLMPDRQGAPLHWRKPRRVFVNSVSDLFHEDVPDEFILDVWATMRLAKRHTFQILTKRPERMRDWVRKWVSAVVYPNVWLGVSVEHQAAADERIPLLLETPAAVRFLSCEPLLGPVDLRRWLAGPHAEDMELRGVGLSGSHYRPGIHWVIVGGESGKHARHMAWHWLGGLLTQCRDADIPIFVKQMGTYWAKFHGLKDLHGGNPDEWPEHLRVREWPHAVPATEGGA